MGGEAMEIEIICTGDEVLTGKIVNTNFSFISQKLEDFGLDVRWGTTVGDTPDEFRTFVVAELDKWAKVVKAAGAKVD